MSQPPGFPPSRPARPVADEPATSSRLSAAPPPAAAALPGSSLPATALTAADREALRQADRQHHWHGFTQMADFEPLLIERGEGNWLIDIDGRRLLDGASSLWCNVHGHAHPQINAAIIGQLQQVAHVTSLGMGAPVTARLAQRLAQIAPGDLDHVFFSSDGSSAVEAALKMAIQYWHLVAERDAKAKEDAKADRASGEPQEAATTASKTKYLAVGAAYHGDTTGAVSLGDIAHFHRLFAPILFEPLRAPCPDTYRLPPGVSPQRALEHYAAEFERLIQQHHAELAAVVIEPLVQGAAGMVMHPPGLLRRVRAACDRHNVLLIADEIATGLGRTGKWFACDHEAVVPDLLCIGKGLTGGYLPMAATLARRPIFEAFLAPRRENKQFFHGHTFGGNPLAAAAAVASLELMESDQVLQRLPAKIERLRRGLAPLRQHRHVGQVRQCGMMAAVELVRCPQRQEAFPAAWELGHRVCLAAMDRGVWIRPLGDVIVLMPPLSVTDAELELLCSALREAVEEVFAGPLERSTAG